MRIDMWIGLGIIVGWFIIGMFMKISSSIFYTGLIAFLIGSFLMKWSADLDDEKKTKGGKK